MIFVHEKFRNIDAQSIGRLPASSFMLDICMLSDESFVGAGLQLPAQFSPIHFPMGNAATGFFVTFALIAGVVGAASAISGINHIRSWTADSLPAAASAATIAWTLTLLAMG